MKYTPNSNYFGVVTGVKDRVFFVRLQVGVNAKTKLYRSIDMPSRLDTVSFRVTGVDEENAVFHPGNDTEIVGVGSDLLQGCPIGILRCLFDGMA